MAGPRLTTPAAKLVRSISTASTAKPTTLLTASKFPAPLSRKYAELLKERGQEGDVSYSTLNSPHCGCVQVRRACNTEKPATGATNTQNPSTLVTSIPAPRTALIPPLAASA